ncbi:MAG: dethiobiotin synthase [Acidobacteria bacterium]|nr:dethiobiotin synthase [Acidobacteriota bacterium]
MIPEALFITGTDTGVGKTAIGAAIALCLREAGLTVAAFKPIETGVPRSGGRLSDGQVLFQASNAVSQEGAGLYTLKHPLAPAVAAEMERVEMDIRQIVERFHQLKSQSDIVIVEGVGGIMVPIRWDYFVLDLIKELLIPVAIVARAGLGTINHTVLTYTALKGKGIEVFAIVLNAYPSHPELAEKTNPDALRRATGFERVFILPQLQTQHEAAVAQMLKPWVRNWFR